MAFWRSARTAAGVHVPRALQALTVAATALVALACAHARAATSQPSEPATRNASPDEVVQEVTVTAQRAKLTKRVRKFVDQIAAQENEEGLPLWTQPVCPSVSGMTRQQGEFILERVSQIAHEAGVRLAGERCRPNLYILVNPRPKDLLRGMEKRNRSFTFGYDLSVFPPVPTSESVVDQFIETPRAVKVWYNSDERDAWGKPLVYNGCVHWRVAVRQVCNAESSRAVSNVIWIFSSVFVIADQRRLEGVTLGQFADYAAMAGLAKLKAGAQLGDAPTILKLFDVAPRAAPPGMTNWDRAFLKSLYGTEQRLKQQRHQVANAMVRQLTH
jgi:hypothetical protein